MPCDVDHAPANETAPTQRCLMLVVGAGLLAFVLALAWLARAATSSRLDVEATAYWLVALSVPAGVVYLLGVRRITTGRVQGMGLGAILVGGLAMRSTLIASPPFLEDDFYRYLWDGAVAAHGLDPYRYAPTQVLWATVGADTVSPELLPLAADSGHVLERVNHPHLTTIYPPVAQVGFAFAHAIGPWSTVSWRLLLLIADGATLAVLLRLLRQLGLPSATVLWYWWNPILLRETYGAAHMDVLILPLLLGAVLLATKKRFTWSMLLLSLAGGVKLWPLILAPLLLRPLFASRRRLLFAGAALLASTLAVWAPALRSAFGSNSGLLAYAVQWCNNAGAFTVLETFVGQTEWFSAKDSFWSAAVATRLLVIAVLAAWTASQVRRPIHDGRDLLRRCLLIVAALFLLSPTQFPWYFVWLTPFLAIVPNVAMLAYSALLPLYHVGAQHPAIPWLEHAPVWLLLIGSLAPRSRRAVERRPLDSTTRLEVANGHV